MLFERFFMADELEVPSYAIISSLVLVGGFHCYIDYPIEWGGAISEGDVKFLYVVKLVPPEDLSIWESKLWKC